MPSHYIVLENYKFFSNTELSTLLEEKKWIHISIV